MRKYVFLLVSLFITFAIQAQTEHLKFMGIPLNGTITQFQSKLATKGLVPNNKINQSIPVGCRAFSGTFSGEKANIYVYYNSKTKIVYRAKAVIQYDKDQVEFKLKNFVSLLQEKYTNSVGEDSEQDGYPSYSLVVLNDDGINPLGIVGLYISKSDYLYSERFLHVDYEDYLNSESNKSSNMDDL